MSRSRQTRPSMRYSLSPDLYSRRATSTSRLMAGAAGSSSPS